jgi:ribonucleoside-diphosphate reductase alpha chain
MLEKQGIQQELLPRNTPPSGVSAVDVAPVVAGVVGSGGEQMLLGGMQETLSGACPDCGSQLEYAEGCVKCHVCGYSECG